MTNNTKLLIAGGAIALIFVGVKISKKNKKTSVGLSDESENEPIKEFSYKIKGKKRDVKLLYTKDSNTTTSKYRVYDNGLFTVKARFADHNSRHFSDHDLEIHGSDETIIKELIIQEFIEKEKNALKVDDIIKNCKDKELNDSIIEKIDTETDSITLKKHFKKVCNSNIAIKDFGDEYPTLDMIWDAGGVHGLPEEKKNMGKYYEYPYTNFKYGEIIKNKEGSRFAVVVEYDWIKNLALNRMEYSDGRKMLFI